MIPPMILSIIEPSVCVNPFTAPTIVSIAAMINVIGINILPTALPTPMATALNLVKNVLRPLKKFENGLKRFATLSITPPKPPPLNLEKNSPIFTNGVITAPFTVDATLFNLLPIFLKNPITEVNTLVTPLTNFEKPDVIFFGNILFNNPLNIPPIALRGFKITMLNALANPPTIPPIAPARVPNNIARKSNIPFLALVSVSASGDSSSGVSLGSTG